MIVGDAIGIFRQRLDGQQNIKEGAKGSAQVHLGLIKSCQTWRKCRLEKSERGVLGMVEEARSQIQRKSLQ